MSGTERILRVCSRRSYFLIVRLGLIGLPHRFRDFTAKYFRDVDGVNCARHSTRCSYDVRDSITRKPIPNLTLYIKRMDEGDFGGTGCVDNRGMIPSDFL